MFLEMRRIEKQLSLAESEAILDKGEYGVLSTISSNGYPYGTPLNYVYSKGYIYFHSAKDGHKIQNVNNNSKVCFSVVGDVQLVPEKFTTKYESVIIFGNAQEVEGEEKVNALLALIEKYSSDYMVSGEKCVLKDTKKTKVIRIKIDRITGKASK